MKRINKNLVDDYCRLRFKIDKLKASEKELRSKMFNEFDAVGVSELAGHNGYNVKRIISSVFTVNPALLFKRVKPLDFLKCVSVSVTKAADLLNRADVLAMSEESERVSLKVQL